MQLQGRKEQLEGELKRINNEINVSEDELSGQPLKQEAFALQVQSRLHHQFHRSSHPGHLT